MTSLSVISGITFIWYTINKRTSSNARLSFYLLPMDNCNGVTLCGFATIVMRGFIAATKRQLMIAVVLRVF